MMNNQPAFPTKAEPYSRDDEHGMTLRDYFAAKAMQGLIANGADNPFILSKAAYVMADAMIKERK